MNKIFKIVLPIVFLIAIAIGAWYFIGFKKNGEGKDVVVGSVVESDVISQNGMHWHPELSIYVKGVKQGILENIGLGVVHKPIHTHDDIDQGIVHMEFQGIVRKQDTELGQFFKNWGRDMRSFGANMRMKVNGQENTEYENYHMRDQDKIELYYE